MPTAQAAQLGCPAACFAAPSEDQGLQWPARQTPGGLSYFVLNLWGQESWWPARQTLGSLCWYWGQEYWGTWIWVKIIIIRWGATPSGWQSSQQLNWNWSIQWLTTTSWKAYSCYRQLKTWTASCVEMCKIVSTCQPLLWLLSYITLCFKPAGPWRIPE